MASGDVVVGIEKSMPPDSSSSATPGVRTGGGTPGGGEKFFHLAFDDSTIEYWDYFCHLEGYGGGGLTIELAWAAASATTSETVWECAIRRLDDDTEDMDAAHTYVFNSVTATTATISGQLAYDSVTFTSGADMDSVTDGERFVLRVRRNASSGSDDMSGDAQLYSAVGRET